MSGKASKSVQVAAKDIKTLDVGEMPSPSTKPNTGNDERLEMEMDLQAEYELLKLKEEQLDKEIASLLTERKQQSETKSYMELLHVYNDVKDATQLVLGNLARLENVSVTELHKQYGLSYKDNDA